MISTSASKDTQLPESPSMTKESNLKELLERSRHQLTRPFAKIQRRLMLLVNVAYMILMPIFLVSEKIATGQFVPHPILGVVYSVVGLVNFVSAAYTFLVFRDSKKIRLWGLTVTLKSDKRTEVALRWASVLSVWLLSICNMIGIGNPSTDSLLVDFALGHSLIILAAMVLGRRAAFVWFTIIVSILFYVTFFKLGYNYRFNYLTPDESIRYERALTQNQQWALNRNAVLKANGLNPPLASRYFNEWLIFIIIAYSSSYIFAGITLDLFKVIPAVTEDIKEAIDATKQDEERRLLVQQEALSAKLKALKAQVNPHFLYNTLYFFYIKSSEVDEELSNAILKLSDIMRYSMREDFDSASLVEEINYMKEFVSLHQLRNENKLFIDFRVSGPVERKSILPFLLIGLVENAFKHGKMTEANHPFIIDIKAYDDRIEFFSSNLKNNKQRSESNNIGLSNTRQRLEKAYDKYTFDVTPGTDIFSCKLTIYA